MLKAPESHLSTPGFFRVVYLMVMKDLATPRQTYLLKRGQYNAPGEKVSPAVPAIFPRLPAAAPQNRLGLAQWLVDPSHPLTARVTVNRYWQRLFGRGLVKTSEDFGVQGELPSHRELFDWLAAEFVRLGWDVKQIHRLILTSATYRQTSHVGATAYRADPENRLLSRGAVRRLDAESVRDAILTISGSLDSKYGGPPVPIMADRVGQWVIGIENLNAGRPGPVLEMQGERYRRSVWVEVRRSRPLAVLDTFDRPAMEPNCTQRVSTTVASQSLLMMNSDFVVSQSARFADRLKEVGSQPVKRIRHAWQLVYSTEPTVEQVTAAVAFVEEQTALFSKPAATDDHKKTTAEETLQAADRAWSVFCQALLSSNRFLYLD